jgi:negative regulator of sigma E activity
MTTNEEKAHAAAERIHQAVAEMQPAPVSRGIMQLASAAPGWSAFSVPVTVAEQRLAAIVAVLADFNWELDDRQYALEKIERIALGEEKP